ncbi:uncharacterized protein METZ01_LOCUS516474, partial [marine metagenome]
MVVPLEHRARLFPVDSDDYLMSSLLLPSLQGEPRGRIVFGYENAHRRSTGFGRVSPPIGPAPV